ncbi:histidine phosphatase family protein [Microlunatus elymi]|uniref:histidine phosphatase family protein n=1 Tax=Microlunatus elymi TaxID=2596828 RepID=UPI001D1823D6|nr:histidine phosphatase family protein [Microlunatus elymi]
MITQERTRIILARHGEATYSSDNGDDATGGILTELGRSQARALGDQLQNREIGAIVCSDLSRATQTAKIAADILRLPIDVRAGLHEYQAGDEPYDVRSLGMALLAWLDGDLAPRILGGESGQEIAQRIRPVLDDLVRAHTGKTVLVVMHGGAIIATLGSIAPGNTGLPTDGIPENLEHDIPGGACFPIEHRQDGWAILPRTAS